MLWKGEQSPRVKKERKPALREESGRVFAVEGTWTMFKRKFSVVSVTTLYLFLEKEVAVVRGEKDDRLLLHPIRRQNRLTARDKNPQRDQAEKGKTHWI